MKKFDSKPFEDFVSEKMGETSYSYQDLQVNAWKIAKDIDITKKRKRRWHIGFAVGFTAFGVGIVGMALAPFARLSSDWNDWSVLREKAVFDAAMLKALNEVQHPQETFIYDLKEKYPLSDEYVQTVNDFAYRLYQGLGVSEKETTLYSPYSLYRLLDLSSFLIKTPEAEKIYSSLIGDTLLRNQNRAPAYYGLNWANQHGEDSFEIRDALFLENSTAPYNQKVIDEFTRAYVEVFGVNLTSEAGYQAILSWMRGNSIDQDLLEIEDVVPDVPLDLVRFMLLTVQNANLTWMNSFSESENVTAPFFLLSGESRNTIYLHHDVFSARAYDYGTYVSAYDHYQAGYTIQYLVPKDLKASIFTLLQKEGRNFLIEDEQKRIVASEEAKGGLALDLYVPKFTNTTHVDFAKAMNALGVTPLFDGEAGSFDRIFEHTEEPIRFGLPKQVNRICLTEDGTRVTTVSFSFGAGAAQPITTDLLKVELNQPFVYVIRDARNLPLYVGANVTGN